VAGTPPFWRDSWP